MSRPGFPSVDLRKVLTTGQLPAMPQSAIRLLELSQSPTCGAAEFALPIEADPGLTVQVLKFVNSSYFGFRHEISNIKQAITLVGMRTIKNFALWSAVFSLIPNPKCGPFDLKCLWQDSLRRALFARAMAKRLGLAEAEEVFAAALLQDMAVPLLAKEAPDAYGKLFGICSQSGHRVRLSMLEKHAFGWTHAEAAGIMARQWHFPEASATLIEDHLGVEQACSRPQQDRGKAAVAMSALLPSAIDPDWPEREQFDQCYGKLCGPDGSSAAEFLAEIDREFCEFAPVLKVAKPSQTLVERYSALETAST